MKESKLKELISNKLIENVDLSELNLNSYDFSKCRIIKVIFSNKNQKARKLQNLNFKDAHLTEVTFEGALLDSCDFDGEKSILEQVSFKKSEIYKCRFRNTTIKWSDFRYCEINSATFENASFDYCDFYRAFLMGVIIFRKSKIENTSLYYTYFNEGAAIRRENLVKDQILQQDESAYRTFLTEWHKKGTGERENEQNRISNWNPENSIENRSADAEDIYKTLNGLWTSKGYLSDANWAYVKGKKMERKRMLVAIKTKLPFSKKIKLSIEILWNFILDRLFGYGESMTKMILTYIGIVFVFAYLYYASTYISLPDYTKALGISFKNMVAMTSEKVIGISPFIDFLNMVQSTVGILLTGIFGFILGNKIRNQ